MKMKKMKYVLMTASVMLLAGAASAGYVLDFVGDAGSGSGTLTISTDGDGGIRGLFALIADNDTPIATINPHSETVQSPFNVDIGGGTLATELWGQPADPYNGYVGGMGGYVLLPDPAFVSLAGVDGVTFANEKNVEVMTGISVTFS